MCGCCICSKRMRVALTVIYCWKILFWSNVMLVFIESPQQQGCFCNTVGCIRGVWFCDTSALFLWCSSWFFVAMWRLFVRKSPWQERWVVTKPKSGRYIYWVCYYLVYTYGKLLKHHINQTSLFVSASITFSQKENDVVTAAGREMHTYTQRNRSTVSFLWFVFFISITPF